MRSTHLTKYAAIAGALAVPLMAAAPASASGGGTSSAYGLSATGLANLPAMPSVSSATSPSHRSLFELPANPMIDLSIVKVTARGGHSSASVVDLRVLTPANVKALRAMLSAKVITARCDNGVGSSKLVDVRLAGKRLAVGASPNSSITVPVQGLGGAQVTINKQVRNADGSLTVTALAVGVKLGDKFQTINISSATCAKGSSGTPTPPPLSPPGQAPKPSPVPSDLPVTG